MAKKAQPAEPLPVLALPPAEGAEGAEDENKRVQVTLTPIVAQQVKIAAAAEGVSVPRYVNDRLADIMEAELPAVMKRLGYIPAK